jgi:hypothetical protein
VKFAPLVTSSEHAPAWPMAVVHKSRLIGEDPMEPVDSTNRGRQDGVI